MVNNKQLIDSECGSITNLKYNTNFEEHSRMDIEKKTIDLIGLSLPLQNTFDGYSIFLLTTNKILLI